MAIGAFPAAKLGVLAIKQISKPIANLIKSNAKQSPVFRKYVCMPPAQTLRQVSKPISGFIGEVAKQNYVLGRYVCMPPARMYNWVEVKTKMWALNLGKPVVVPPLNEAMAIELGANLLGEFIIFVIGAGLLIFEYARQSSNEAKKQDALRQEKAELSFTLAEMGFRLERQDAQIREMTRALADLESRSLFKWHRETISEYQPFNRNTPNQSSVSTKTFNGVYDPYSGLLYKALNFLETRIFIDGRKSSKTESLHIEPIEELHPYVFVPAQTNQLAATQ